MKALFRLFRLGGYLEVTLSGASTTPNADAVLESLLVKCIGTPSATTAIVLPAEKSLYVVVWNATTSVVNVRTPSGSSTRLEAGEVQLLVCDGTDYHQTPAAVVPTITVSTGTSITLTRARHQIRIVRTGGEIAGSVALPPDPIAGDVVEVHNQDVGLHDVSVTRNGKKINGGTSTYTMTGTTAWARFVYVDSTTGWASCSAKL